MTPANRFLTWSALAAANTLNAHKPFARQGPGSVLSFAAGWPTSDLPYLSIGAHALGVAVAARRGVLKTPQGVAGLALTGASIAGLISLRKLMDQAEPIVEDALRSELGDDYRQHLAEAVETARPTFRAPRVPSPKVRKAYVRGEHISYADAGRRTTLDVWSRPDLPTERKAPVLLQIHGGAWVIGDKEGQAYPLMTHLAERGWVCVSVSYRLSPRATWPDHIVDIKRAIAWVKDNIADHGGDPDWIAITGGSAGGHLSSLAALTPNDPAFQPGFTDVDTSVQAAVPFYGVYDWTNREELGHAEMLDFLADRVVKRPLTDSEVFESASPMSRIHGDAPPMFVLHGANDSLVPVEQARRFVELLREESTNPVVYAEFPGAQHAFDVFDNPRTSATVRGVERFLDVARAER